MADPIGSIDRLAGVVKVRHADGSTEVLRQGAQVYQGDTLETGGDGSVGVVFVDKSTFSLGPKGRMVMDEMVFDPAHPGDGHATLVALNGVFSFVSGQVAKSAPDAMTIKTPVMTIGVRGTSVAGVAASEGAQNVVTLLRDGDGTLGQVTVSNAAGSTVLNAEAQTLMASSFVRTFEPPRQLSAAEVMALFAAALAAQPLPPAPPPAVPQPNSQPPAQPPAGQDGDGHTRAQPENGDAPPTPPVPTPPEQTELPVDPTQLAAALGLANVLFGTDLSTGSLDPQAGPGAPVQSPERDASNDLPKAEPGGGQGETGGGIIVGTAGGDILAGTGGDDEIYGLGGDDTLYGLGGNDTLAPGDGNDTVFAGDGDDRIELTLDGAFDMVDGGSGHDTLSYGGEFSNLIVDMSSGVVYDGSDYDMFTGIEVFVGGLGNDQVTGSTGDDTIYGGIGSDSLIGNLGDDVLYGEVGNDTLEGGQGDDILDGGAGDDDLYAGPGADTVYGGTGDDVVFLSFDNDDDTVDGGTGEDTVSFWSETATRVEVSLSAGTATYLGSDSQTHTDTIRNVENVIGGSGNDWLVGDAGANVLSGGHGDDTLVGGAGDDALVDGEGRDTLVGGDGLDTITLAADGTADLIKISGSNAVSAGTDTITGFEVGTDHIEILADVFTGLSNNDVNYGIDLNSAISAGTTQIVGVDDGGSVNLYYVTASGESYQIASIADTTTSALSSAGSVTVT